MDDPKRARSWKRPIRPRTDLPNVAPVLYSTQTWSKPWSATSTVQASTFSCNQVERSARPLGLIS